MIHSWDYCDKLDKNSMINPKNRNISHLRNLKTWDSLMPFRWRSARGKSSLALSSGWGTKRNSPQNGRDESTDVHRRISSPSASKRNHIHVIRCHQMSYFCIENRHFSRFFSPKTFSPSATDAAVRSAI